jgi:hypothetical protein
MESPIVFIIFNRPELTQRVFEEIKIAKPKKLFIISDGPRTTQEKLLVEQTRSVVEHITWKCEVVRKYADQNLGCRKSVSTGLDWVFSKVERAIILEDDCVPHSSFFPYCEELLEKYKDDERIAMISGNNFFTSPHQYSYGFSRHSLIWGWATWKRTWEKYHHAEKKGVSFLMENYEALSSLMKSTRLQAIKKTLLGKIDTWDYILQYALLISKGLCIFPSVNLVKNTGFDMSATHTKRPTFHAKLQTHPIVFPLIHPKHIEVDGVFEKKMENTYNRFYILFDLLRQFFRL